jgi:hypothetical protein
MRAQRGFLDRGIEIVAGQMQPGWNGNHHENERTDDSKVQFQLTSLGKQDPCRHHQPKCEAGAGCIDEWVELI